MADISASIIIARGSLDHLGIVAGIYDELGIGAIIDHCVAKSRHHHLIHGQAVKAMMLNSLGFCRMTVVSLSGILHDHLS